MRKSNERRGSDVRSILTDHGPYASTCGYCKSKEDTSCSHDLLDRGWRRSGTFLYKPTMDDTCCPPYTIRLKADSFVPSKDHLKVLKKMDRYLSGEYNGPSQAPARGGEPTQPSPPASPVAAASPSTNRRSRYALSDAEGQTAIALEAAVARAVEACIARGTLPASARDPASPATVRRIPDRVRKRLKQNEHANPEIPDGAAEFTSNVAFPIAAAACGASNGASHGTGPSHGDKPDPSKDENSHGFASAEGGGAHGKAGDSGLGQVGSGSSGSITVQDGEAHGNRGGACEPRGESHGSESVAGSFPGLEGLSAHAVAERIAGFVQVPGVTTVACRGHVNFHVTAAMMVGSEETSLGREDGGGESRGGGAGRGGAGEGTSADGAVVKRRRELEVTMKRSAFDLEEYELYRKYQMAVHEEPEGKVSQVGYRRFLVDSPFPDKGGHLGGGGEGAPACGYGAFHQQYRIDGRLVAVGVVDVLPKCLSSKYLFWDPDFAFLSLGKYSALQEIEWVKKTTPSAPRLQFYYLGYYIHTCPKMRYKVSYAPSELLCPLRYQWVPHTLAQPLIEAHGYAVLSDALRPAASGSGERREEQRGGGQGGAGGEGGGGGKEGEEGDVENAILAIPAVVNRHVIPLEMCFSLGILDQGDAMMMDQVRTYVRAVGPKLATSIGYKLG